MDAVTTKGNMVTFQGIIFTVENYDDGLVELMGRVSNRGSRSEVLP